MEVRDQISKHEITLGGMLECIDSAYDLNYYHKRETMKTKVNTCFGNFQLR